MPETVQSLPTDLRTPERAALRLFFVDEKTGDPVPGVVVSLFADPPGADSSRREAAPSGGRRRHLATLQTDRAGYVSFKLDRQAVAAGSRLAVSQGGARGDVLAVDAAELLAGDDTRTIPLDAAAYAAIPHSGLPAILLPDVKDLTVSPASIAFVPHLAIGGGLCGQLTPTALDVRRFGAFLIRADLCHPETLDCAGTVQIVTGKMLEYEIAWHSLGVALGELLNTITLAPCEQVNVAVADWMRREMAAESQASEVRQQSWQEMSHDRLILETMQSSVGKSGSTWGLGGTLGVSAPLKKLNLTAGLGGGYFKSTSTQNVDLNTTSQLSEHIAQAASFVASQRSTVVFQATASEQQTYQTRTVRNHNHCHTLTLMYYQIDRKYRVVTNYQGYREVVLVKYDNPDFDAHRAYCASDLLKEALLDRSLLGCFDELADALFCCGLKPAAAAQELLVDSVTVTFWVGKGDGNTWGFNGTLNLTDGSAVHFSVPSQSQPLPQVWQWQAGTVHSVTIALPTPVDPQKLASVVLMAIGRPPVLDFTFSKIELTAHSPGLGDPLLLYTSQGDVSFHEQPWNWLAWLKAEVPEPSAGKNECVEKSCCIQKLLGHLNCHKRYYNGVLWLNEDPNERIMRWACCVRNGEPFSLADSIQNEPIAIHGDFLVFPVAGGELVDDSSVLPVSQLVTMPTPGVYCEGILGQCDTCEKLDADRFWNWKDSPCTDSAPAVSGPPEPQSGTKPDDLKADAISNLITFSSVPGAPDSALKDLISELVAKADSGSSEAKGLLDNLLQKLLEKIK